MTTPVRIGMIDESREQTSMTLHLPDVASDGTNWPTLFADTTGAYDLLKVPLIALTKLNLTRSTAAIPVDQSVGSAPADKTAQREMAMRVIYADDVTGDKYRFDIPAPVDAAFEANTDEVDIENNVIFGAFKTVFEAQCVSPDGNPVTILRAYRAGRRS